MVEKMKVKRAYEIFTSYNMLDKIMYTYFNISASTKINFDEFYDVIIRNQNWLSSLTVFLDMDNTLARFSNGNRDAENSIRKSVLKGFFESLQTMDDDINIYEALSCIGVKIYILSACINTPYCRKEKRAWLKKHMPWIKNNQIIFCNIDENKSIIALQRAKMESLEWAILIDDYKHNLLKWLEAGGKAIKKGTSYKPNRPYPTLINHKDGLDMVLSTGYVLANLK